MRFNEPFACSIDKQFSRFVRFQFSCKLAVLRRKISEVSTILFRPSTTQKTIIRLSMSKPINAPFMLKPKAVKTRQKSAADSKAVGVVGGLLFSVILHEISLAKWFVLVLERDLVSKAPRRSCVLENRFLQCQAQISRWKKTASHHKAQCWSRGKPETSSIQRTFPFTRSREKMIAGRKQKAERL